MSLILTIVDILTLILGVFGGFFLGRYDARKSESELYTAISGQTSGIIVSLREAFEATNDATGKVSEQAIEEFRKEHFEQISAKLMDDARRSKVSGLTIVILTIILFSVAHLLVA